MLPKVKMPTTVDFLTFVTMIKLDKEIAVLDGKKAKLKLGLGISLNLDVKE